MNRTVKCLVWDLDNTLWDGTLLESDSCRLRYGARSVLRELDRRGVLLSIASANPEELAMSLLRQKGIHRADGAACPDQLGEQSEKPPGHRR